MEAIKCLLTRRSVRKFQDKSVDKKTVEEIIEIAQYAPSAHNKQPWEFVVIDDKKFLRDLQTYQKYTVFAENAPMAIIVCANTEIAVKDDQNNSYADIDCALATQNLLLAAHAKGLGTCYCASAPMPIFMNGVSKSLSLPENIRPVAIVIVGHPLYEPKQPTDRYKVEKIHWSKW